MVLKEQDWEGWWFHPCTQHFLKSLRDSRMELMEDWAQGAHCGENVTLELNAVAIGEARMLQKMIELVDDCKPKEKQDDGSNS